MIHALRRRAPEGRAPLLVVLAVAMLPGCTPAEQEPRADAETQLEAMDALMVELGGRPTADLTRGQRWRLISSVGVGLPPSDYKEEDLPEPQSLGAQLVTAFCDRCHWIPAPQQHAASEWPLLMRRMHTRAETLGERLGGPITESLMGEYVLAGMATAPLPTEGDAGSFTGRAWRGRGHGFLYYQVFGVPRHPVAEGSHGGRVARGRGPDASQRGAAGRTSAGRRGDATDRKLSAESRRRLTASEPESRAG
jgi:hypothetical protein